MSRPKFNPIVVAAILVAGFVFACFWFLGRHESHYADIEIGDGFTIAITRITDFDIGYPMYVYTVRRGESEIGEPRRFSTGHSSPKFLALGEREDRYAGIIRDANATQMLIIVDKQERASWPYQAPAETWETTREKGERLLAALRDQLDDQALELSE